MLVEHGEGGLHEQVGRQKRLGQLRTDTHTLYDISFRALDSLSSRELQKIVNDCHGEYSAGLQAEARLILHARADPVDRDSTEIEM